LQNATTVIPALSARGILERLEEFEYETKKGLTSSALAALERLLSAVALTKQ